MGGYFKMIIIATMTLMIALFHLFFYILSTMAIGGFLIIIYFSINALKEINEIKNTIKIYKEEIENLDEKIGKMKIENIV